MLNNLQIYIALLFVNFLVYIFSRFFQLFQADNFAFDTYVAVYELRIDFNVAELKRLDYLGILFVFTHGYIIFELQKGIFALFK